MTYLYVVAGVATVGVIWFFGKPWIKPLYQRYLAFVERKASGK